MSTAQQLGLIGNSIKVQSLPTASAETFGVGNRFYTLIGQQEGYITGHTYRTVVANDVYSWEDVAQAGPQGEDGLPALVCNDMWGFLKVGLSNARTETFNRTPIVGEKVVIFSTENQYALATIESVSETTVGVRFSGPIISTKGATGQQGPAGTTVYNNLSDIPVINQDLSASGFTPVANTYYRHTGATTDTFTQGVIYLYDTAYHKLGESGGGTTLNKYTYTQYNYLDTTANKRLKNILQNAKGNILCNSTAEKLTYSSNDYWTEIVKFYINASDDGIMFIWNTNKFSSSSGTWSTGAIYTYNMSTNTLTTETLTNNDPQSRTTVVITYYNDTEIT